MLTPTQKSTNTLEYILQIAPAIQYNICFMVIIISGRYDMRGSSTLTSCYCWLGTRGLNSKQLCSPGEKQKMSFLDTLCMGYCFVICQRVWQKDYYTSLCRLDFLFQERRSKCQHYILHLVHDRYHTNIRDLIDLMHKRECGKTHEYEQY